MLADIKKLISLQACDLKIKDLIDKKETGPLRIKELENELNELENQLQEQLDLLEDFKCEKRAAEQEIEDVKNRIDKSNGKLSNIKSNKEYKAALKEIESFNQVKKKIEDTVLEFLEKIEESQGQYNLKKTKIEEQKKIMEQHRLAIIDEMKCIDNDLQMLEEERVDISDNVSKGILKKYDFIRKGKGGIGISSVIDSVCQTCRLGIPRQKYHELIKGNEIMVCPNCSRIIYWGEDEYCVTAL